MKQSIALAAAWLLAATLNLHAQGSLTPPPGAPAPVMKTLDQIEARTPISTVPFTISQSGSYYLTGNLSLASGNAITISTSGVTLDLNGFTLSSTTDVSATGTGIQISGGPKDITISNGHIRGGLTYDSGTGTYSGNGFSYGIAPSGSSPQNVVISHVTVSGCRFHGIVVGSIGVVVESCAVRTVGSIGINGSIINNCIASDCGTAGFSGQEVSNCRGTATGTGDGIFANAVSNSTGISVTGKGINCTIATNSVGVSTSGTGIVADTAQNCFGRTTSGTRGMLIDGAASFCRGQNDSVGGVAIQAAIAVGCTVQTGTISSAQKHLGTP